MKQQKICKICKKNFLVWPSEIKRGRGFYCSRKCYYISRKGFYPFTESTRNKVFSFKKGHVAWNKGKKMVYIHGMLGKHHTEETRRKISAKHLDISLNQWGGLVSKQDKLERLRFRYFIQKQVFKRDNYTCQMCGGKGKNLQVDHIQPWADYVELRFCIDNCRTLCANCHYKITFGKPMPPTVRAWGHNLFKEETKNI